MSFVLCCTKRGMLRKVMGSSHCFEVEATSPIGAALRNTIDSGGPYVVLSSLPQFRPPCPAGPFRYLNLSDDDLHPLLNCGKEWVFRTIFTTGEEVISDKTGATFQSFQTRLRLNSRGHFDIITHISACRDSKCFSFNIKNHFALVPTGEAPSYNTLPAAHARADFIKDMQEAMKKVNAPGSRFIVPQTPEFKADDFYGNSAPPQAGTFCESPFPQGAMMLVMNRRNAQ